MVGCYHLLGAVSLRLIEKLAALVPPPRLTLVQYHGGLAPNASEGSQIVRSTFCGRIGGGSQAGSAKPMGWPNSLVRSVIVSQLI